MRYKQGAGPADSPPRTPPRTKFLVEADDDNGDASRESLSSEGERNRRDDEEKEDAGNVGVKVGDVEVEAEAERAMLAGSGMGFEGSGVGIEGPESGLEGSGMQGMEGSGMGSEEEGSGMQLLPFPERRLSSSAVSVKDMRGSASPIVLTSSPVVKPALSGYVRATRSPY
eukprot:3685951-Rhodomonas_salina.7